eukprot:10145958-Alexandrium_andersonii.AAC.1
MATSPPPSSTSAISTALGGTVGSGPWGRLGIGARAKAMPSSVRSCPGRFGGSLARCASALAWPALGLAPQAALPL